MSRIEEIYYEAKADKWLKRFAVFAALPLQLPFLLQALLKLWMNGSPPVCLPITL
ncbi:hypothetical protein [Mucilaginibacter sp.]|uniref:hypothetical protein n=1 Tax=Mucilaginibacter sp. TaxID=1882438 RepID=UPI003265CF36